MHGSDFTNRQLIPLTHAEYDLIIRPEALRLKAVQASSSFVSGMPARLLTTATGRTATATRLQRASLQPQIRIS